MTIILLNIIISNSTSHFHSTSSLIFLRGDTGEEVFSYGVAKYKRILIVPYVPMVG